MPASVWCLAFFVLCELVAAFWIAYFLSCPCCWPFRVLLNRPECHPKTDPQCPIPPCVRKCCPPGEELFRNSTNKQTYCIQVPSSKFNLSEIPLWEGDWIKKRTFEEDFTRFSVVNYGLCTNGMYVLDPLYDLDQYALLPTGRLLMIIERKVIERDAYCMENYAGGNSTNVFRCFPTVTAEGATTADVEMKMFPVGMVISLPFFIATVFVYSILPELQNLHGKTLICHVTSITVGYTFLILVQRNVLEMNGKHPDLCVVCGK